MVSQFLPNQTAHTVVGCLLVVLTLAIVVALGRAAWRAHDNSRWHSLAWLGVFLALGTLSATYALRWHPGVPDIIYAQDGMYQWGSGFTDAEPAGGGCQTHAQLVSHGVRHLSPAGWLTGASTDGDAWTATVGRAGYMRVYRADRWTLVVIPHPDCYVVFGGQG